MNNPQSKGTGEEYSVLYSSLQTSPVLMNTDIRGEENPSKCPQSNNIFNKFLRRRRVNVKKFVHFMKSNKYW